MNTKQVPVDLLDHGLATNILTTFVAITIAVVVFKARCRRGTLSRKPAKDPYSIDPCPNPDCVRCQKYAIVQQQAIRKLPWIVKKEGCSLDRITEGIRLGRDQPRNQNMALSPSSAQYPTVLLIPHLTTRPLLTDMHNSACSYMEEMVDVIASEFQSAPRCHLWNHNDVEGTAAPWKVLQLMNQGQWIHHGNNDEDFQLESLSELFPQTIQAVQRLENLLQSCVFGNVFFSRIQSGSRIAPHCGPTNVRHRLHLTIALEDVSSSCVLHVREECMRWRQRRAFVFDDSLLHSVEYENNIQGNSRRSNESERVVLIVDLWHPELTSSERTAICDLYPTKTLSIG